MIATPNQLHVANGLSAVRAGVPMLLEKPVSGDVESAMELVNAAEAANVPILVGHHRRHSPLIQRAKEIVGSGRLGKITAVNGLCLFRKPKDYFEGKSGWRREPGGGVVLINLIHVIDDLRNICGDIIAIQAAESNAARGFAVEDTAAMILHFASGALGTLTISDAANAPWSWELTSGENKAYPYTDQFCYLVSGMEGSVTIPRLDFWRHQGDGWWTPMNTERSIVPEQNPLTIANAPFLRSDPGRGDAGAGRPGRYADARDDAGRQEGGGRRGHHQAVLTGQAHPQPGVGTILLTFLFLLCSYICPTPWTPPPRTDQPVPAPA